MSDPFAMTAEQYAAIEEVATTAEIWTEARRRYARTGSGKGMLEQAFRALLHRLDVLDYYRHASGDLLALPREFREVLWAMPDAAKVAARLAASDARTGRYRHDGARAVASLEAAVLRCRCAVQGARAAE